MADKQYKKFADILAALRKFVGDAGHSGSKVLPGERELAERFGAGRPTIAKALDVLAGEGRICRTHGGTRLLPQRQRHRYGYLASCHEVNGAFWFSAYQRLWEHLEKQFAAANLHVDLLKFYPNGSSVAEQLEAFRDYDVIFLSLVGRPRSELVVEKLRSQGSCVFLLNETDELPDYPLYALGNREVGRIAAETLLARGYRQAAIMGPTVNASSHDFRRRIAGFLDAWESGGGGYTGLFLSYLNGGMEELMLAQKCFDKLPLQNFDCAFFLCDDWISIADELIEGKGAPRFGVLAFDGTMKARRHFPPIDTLTHGTVPLATKLREIAEEMENGSFVLDPTIRCRLSPTLIPGETLHPLPAQTH
ncbi:MAG: GntR family transcriptional regulator [Victivallaceae bacterium]|nr:GntR family transcriptional regulator [Victivallaceae bacterium]